MVIFVLDCAIAGADVIILEPATAVRPAAVPVRNLRRDIKIFPPENEFKAVLSRYMKAYR
ncbi:MAG: hypothetical protein ACJA0Z_002009 [Halioglobus sp.]|jgi:hypothetical protein